ncbi:hypothetical protein CFP56_026633 [Quercus suber]|uniref:Uncharacterized protein n=1 Tax=Quercus suber TaxID=58331 RepID=A0AAW0JZ79_QUESU
MPKPSSNQSPIASYLHRQPASPNPPVSTLGQPQILYCLHRRPTSNPPLSPPPANHLNPPLCPPSAHSVSAASPLRFQSDSSSALTFFNWVKNDLTTITDNTEFKSLYRQNIYVSVAAVGLVCFLIFKGIQGLIQALESIKMKEKRVLQFYLPQVEAASVLSITLALAWQKAIREWALFMVPFILWSSFVMSLFVGILLICFQKPATEGVGIYFIAFAIGNGLYACWVTTAYNRLLE